ncbi:MAG: Kelch repeat-containing protein [Woeseiaceae bacterium]
MKRSMITIGMLAIACCASAASPRLQQGEPVPAVPEPVSNNAVASVDLGGGKFYLVSFSGLGPGKTHGDTHSLTWVWRSGWDDWKQAPDVPDGGGRLASVAVAVGDLIYVFGGYTVAEDGAEVSTPWVHTFDPVTMKFERVSAMPVPVDDTVAVVYEDRYVYLISGWHDYGNVNLVQRFDTQTSTWSQATPTPGPGVFGHAGGIVGNRILYCDGVAIEPQADRRRDFKAVGDCYLGVIDETNSRQIDWRTIAAHPELPRYRMAAIGLRDPDSIMFVGGTENPYNFNGIGYDGEPSTPVSNVLLYAFDEAEWWSVDVDGIQTMDQRGLVRFGNSYVTVGGMVEDQTVTPKVLSWKIEFYNPH